MEGAEKRSTSQRILDITTFLEEQPTLIEECDEQIIRRLIEKVMVFEEKFVVEFKSGIQVDVKI